MEGPSEDEAEEVHKDMIAAAGYEAAIDLEETTANEEETTENLDKDTTQTVKEDKIDDVGGDKPTDNVEEDKPTDNVDKEKKNDPTVDADLGDRKDRGLTKGFPHLPGDSC